jgi:hypothetical protein
MGRPFSRTAASARSCSSSRLSLRGRTLRFCTPSPTWGREDGWVGQPRAHPVVVRPREGRPRGHPRLERQVRPLFAVKAGLRCSGDGKWHDGMVVAHILRTNPKRSVALKAQADDLFPGSSDLQKQLHDWLTKERAGAPRLPSDTGTELEEPTYADVPLEIIEPYGKEDCVLTRKVGDIQYPLLYSNEKLTGTSTSSSARYSTLCSRSKCVASRPTSRATASWSRRSSRTSSASTTLHRPRSGG